jgi:hypothetical protein
MLSVTFDRRPWMWLRQTEHICGLFYTDIYITVNQVMVAIYTVSLGTLGSVSSLFVATLYQGNIDRNHKLWNDILLTWI